MEADLSIELEYVRAEMHTQFANIATPNEVVVVTTFTIELGSIGGQLNICMPYSLIEPVRDLLSSPLQGEALEVDRRWIRLLSQQVQTADVELEVNLAEITSDFLQILNMQVGDVLPLNLPETVVAKVDGVPVMECGYGIFNGQYALRVQRMISAADGSRDGVTNDTRHPPHLSRIRKPTMSEEAEAGLDDWASAMAEQTSVTAAEAPAPAAFQPLTGITAPGTKNDIDMILDIPVQMTVELGRTKIAIKNLLQLAQVRSSSSMAWLASRWMCSSTVA